MNSDLGYACMLCDEPGIHTHDAPVHRVGAMSNVGRLIYGYCNGAFGRDHYHDCRIEAEGADWIVVRRVDGDRKTQPEFASFDSEAQKIEQLHTWMVPTPEEFE